MAHRSRARFILATVLGSAGIAAVALLGVHPAGAAESFAVPAPAVDEPASAAGTETAVLAGGCFWGVQGVFQHVNGVTQAESGYAGGAKETADYETVGTGSTGHAESVRITYDPTKVTYGRLLQIYFSVVTDPTQLDRQGPDVGSQYRSAIFAQNADQQRIAAAYIAQLSQATRLPRPDHDEGRAEHRVLPRRGVPPELPGLTSDIGVHRDERQAQSGRSGASVSSAVPRSAGAGVGGLIQFRLGFARDAVPFGRQVQPAVPGPAVFIVESVDVLVVDPFSANLGRRRPCDEAAVGSGQVTDDEQALIRERANKTQRLGLDRGQSRPRVRTFDERVDLTEFHPIDEARNQNLFSR